MLQNMILRIRIKLGLKLLALCIFFGVLGWISARFLGDSSFPTFILKVMAGLMIIGVVLVIIEPLFSSAKHRPHG